MLVIAMQTGFPAGERVSWAGRRHDDDWADASSGMSAAELFDAVFGALHDGEQVTLGLDCPLCMPLSPNHRPGITAAGAAADAAAAGAASDAAALVELALPTAGRPGLAELGQLLDELGTWRPWTRVSTSLTRWRANTSILVWQANPAPDSSGVTASAAVDSFFRQLTAARAVATDQGAGTVVNMAAAAARRAGLLVDPTELSRPAATITVTDR